MHSTKSTKSISLYTITILSTLVLSGFLASPAIIAQNSPPTPPTFTSASLGARAAPTYFGSSAGLNPLFLSGPFSAPAAFGPPPTNPFGNPTPAASTNAATSAEVSLTNPDHGSKPAFTSPASNPTLVDPPHSVCSPSTTAGCEAVSDNSGGTTTNAFALNAVPQRLAYGFNISPPDLGLCANSQYVVESVNIGNVQVYDSKSLQPLANGFATLVNLMGLSSHGAQGWSIGGDIMCQFDSANGGHWFFTSFVSTTPGPAGFFSGCAPGAPDACREGIAVSTTSNPMGAYNVYFLDPNYVNNDPGSASNGGPTILNDFAKTALTANAFLLFYNEYNDVGAGFTGQFNGAQEFAFSKTALETGVSAASVNVAYENMAVAPNIYPIPASASFQPAPGLCSTFSDPNTQFPLCWPSVIPAQTPDPSQYDGSNGGTAWMVASLDLIGFGDNRIATFTLTGLCNLDSSCASPATVTFGGTLYTTPQIVYMDEGFACPIVFGGFCGLADQKTGPIPLGDNCGNPLFADSVIAASCPEAGIATNGDATTQASYAHGQIWTAVSTSVTQSFRGSNEVHVGAAFWAIGSSSVNAGGVVSAAHEDIEMPSIAATDGGSALMSFTLSGPDFFPSSAYTWLTSSGDSTIHVTALGQAPEDGFTQYLFYPNDPNFRPRWGDYGAAIFVPSHDGKGSIVFSSEYIQYPNCSDQVFLSIAHSGIRCGGTRASSTNWGTSINSIPSS